MKKFTKILCLLFAGVLALGLLAACGRGRDDNNNGGNNSGNNGGGDTAWPTISISVQNSTVKQNESNAIIATMTDMPEGQTITYEIAPTAAELEYEELAQTSNQSYAFICHDIGSFTVRAAAKIGDMTYVSNRVEFTVEEEGGAVFGSSPAGNQPTINVDFSHDNGTDSAYLEHKGVDNISNEYAYVKGIESTQFCFTTTIDLVGINGGEQYPKAGIFARSGNTVYYLAFDMRSTYNYGDIAFVQASGIDWYWPGQVVNQPMSFRNGDERVTHSLTLLRDGEYFYCAVDGDWIACYYVPGFQVATAIGTYTMSQHAIYSDYMCSLPNEEYYEAMWTEAAAEYQNGALATEFPNPL